MGYGGAVPRPIHSVRVVAAPPEVVHDLLVDPRAWSAWAPEHAWDESPPGRLVEGWSGRLRARLGPAVAVRVVWTEAPRGVDWEGRLAGHRLLSRQRVGPHEAGSRVTLTAEVEGPLGPLLTRLARLAAPRQRRALAHLAAVAELVAAREANEIPAEDAPATQPG